MKLMRQQVLRSGPNISVERIEKRRKIEERLTSTMKEKEEQGAGGFGGHRKSVVLRVVA